MEGEAEEIPAELRSGLAPINQQRRVRAMSILRQRGLSAEQIKALIMFASGNRCADVMVATEEYLDGLSRCVKELGSLVHWWTDEEGHQQVVFGEPLPLEDEHADD